MVGADKTTEIYGGRPTVPIFRKCLICNLDHFRRGRCWRSSHRTCSTSCRCSSTSGSSRSLSGRSSLSHRSQSSAWIRRTLRRACLVQARPTNTKLLALIFCLDIEQIWALTKWGSVLYLKDGSHYTANLLQPLIDGCKTENFPIFCSDLRRPSPLRQSQWPVTSVNEP